VSTRDPQRTEAVGDGREGPGGDLSATVAPTEELAGAATDGSAPPTADSGGLRGRRALIGAIVAVVLLVAGGIYVWQASQRVSIDNASLTAPQTNAVTHGGGVLKEVYGSVGDSMLAHRSIARVGNEVVTSDVAGTITSIRQDIGAYVPAGQLIATLINRDDLRVVGRLKEDQGLASIHIGQRADVTVDALGGRDFRGTVENVSKQPRDAGIAFSISDKRQEREYEVTVRLTRGPDAGMQQGMSARIWVYK
jgi:HlyD family secretion protein